MKEEFKVILSDHDLSTDDDCSYGIVVQTINQHPNYGQVRKNLNRLYYDSLLTKMISHAYVFINPLEHIFSIAQRIRLRFRDAYIRKTD